MDEKDIRLHSTVHQEGGLTDGAGGCGYHEAISHSLPLLLLLLHGVVVISPIFMLSVEMERQCLVKEGVVLF